MPCTGDVAHIRLGTDPTVVEIAERHGTIVRTDVAPGSSGQQLLATNVDVVAICEPCHPKPNLSRLERMLALAWESGAEPVMVMTKADLADDLESIRDDIAALAFGVPVLPVTATTGGGLDAVRAFTAEGRTLALLGRSGAGKSTLINALLGEDAMATRGLRSDGRGRHTTTHRQLLVLPNGGFIIDTPGLKTVGLSSGEGLDRAFSDIEGLAASCRFSDCGHRVEPDCAVLTAVDDGELTQRRLDSYRKLQREAAYQARRTDARLAAEERAKWKHIHQQARRASRARP
jgi:ribosome biogenesis GTPase